MAAHAPTTGAPMRARPYDRRFVSFGDAPNAEAIILEDPDTFPRIYASGCVGSCLEPVFQDGCVLVFDKEAPCEGGDFVAVWLTPEAIRPGEPGRMVKRLALGLMPGLTFPYVPLAGNVKPAVVLEMFNPPRTFTIPVEHIRAMHRVIAEAKSTGDGTCRIVARIGEDGERIPVAEAA